MSNGKTVWRHVLSVADVEYNERETQLAVERGVAKWPRRPGCSVPLEYGYRWCARLHVPLEYDIDSLEWRDIELALADKETNRFLKRPDGSLMETKRLRVWRVPLERPLAINAHQGERAQDVLDALTPLAGALPKQLTAGIGRGAA